MQRPKLQYSSYKKRGEYGECGKDGTHGKLIKALRLSRG
jgi:hypothetical protein